MSTIKVEIDTKTPMPESFKEPAVGGARKYPWYELEVGQSFVVPVPIDTFRTQVYQMNKQCLTKKLTNRYKAVTETKESTRIWRIE
jgi:hypothetical protein